MKTVTMLASALVALALLTQPATAEDVAGGYSNWMGRNRELLKDRAVNDVTLLGSHDAATSDMNKDSPVCIGFKNDSGGRMKPFPSKKDIEKFKCQKASIKKQLLHGVRYLDLRVAYQDGEYWSHHGYLSTRYQGPEGIFAQIRDFLKTNPDEVVILNMQHFYSDEHEMGTADLARFYETVTSELGGLLIPGGKPTVKMGEIWQRQGRIVMIWSTDTKFSDPNNTVWDHRLLKDHWFRQKDRDFLIEELDGLVSDWRNDVDRDRFRELQAIQSSNKKIKSAPITNEMICQKVATDWKDAPISIIMVNDSVNSGLMPLLMLKNGLK